LLQNNNNSFYKSNPTSLQLTLPGSIQTITGAPFHHTSYANGIKLGSLMMYDVNYTYYTYVAIIPDNILYGSTRASELNNVILNFNTNKSNSAIWIAYATLSSLVFDSTVSDLTPTFLPGTTIYIATNVPVIPYTVTLTPIQSYSNSTITVNNNTVSSGAPITLALAIGIPNVITIVVSCSGYTPRTYTITFPVVLSKSSTVFSGVNSVGSTSTQRLLVTLDNTTLTSPIVQFVQDISQNETGYTSNNVTQRFIFGSSTLTNPLEINSTVNSTGTSVSSNVKANNFFMYSDVRLKENIEVLSETQGVDNIRVVQYDNKSDHSKHFGVIAHELAEIYPELVQGSAYDDNNMQSVSYVELIPLCINEIQMLKKKQASLNSQLLEQINKYKHFSSFNVEEL
jgi:hypothetical protein